MDSRALVLSVAMAVAAGLIGCFAVMRRMTLAADAISHVALPGIGIALALHLNPTLGALAMLLLGTLLIWIIETHGDLPTETVIGVVFSAALAVGSLLASGEELIEALLGRPGKLDDWEIALALAGAALVVAFVLRAKDRLVLALVSPEMAHASGIDVRRIDLGYLLTFALAVALGLRYLGVLLMGSLIIIPAATAKRLARNLRQMLLLAAGLAVVATVAGTVGAQLLHRETGPPIVTVAAACFFLSLAVRRPA